jgi:hypothetical protein
MAATDGDVFVAFVVSTGFASSAYGAHCKLSFWLRLPTPFELSITPRSEGAAQLIHQSFEPYALE